MIIGSAGVDSNERRSLSDAIVKLLLLLKLRI